MTRHAPPARRLLPLVSLSALLVACATPSETTGPLRREQALAVTTGNELLRFNAGQPQAILERRPLSGLAAGDSLIGIDFRVARGQLYGLGASGRLYRIDVATGVASALGDGPAFSPSSNEYGFDFNPSVDRIRVVSPAGDNLRLHPDTGAQVDGDADMPGVQTDAALAYAAGDPNAGRTPRVVAAAYTYNQDDEKITSNYAIDAAGGTLVLQGSREGTAPVVSPNTGRLTTVGPLGIRAFSSASFDIADVSNAAYLAAAWGGRTRWYAVDLKTGAASLIGTLATTEAVRGIAIEP